MIDRLLTYLQYGDRFCGIERVRETTQQTDNTVFEDVNQVEMLNPINLLEQAFANDKDMAGQSVPNELKDLLNQVISELTEQEQL